MSLRLSSVRFEPASSFPTALGIDVRCSLNESILPSPTDEDHERRERRRRGERERERDGDSERELRERERRRLSRSPRLSARMDF
eukprot:7062875-Prymnesium_polylepis.2